MHVCVCENLFHVPGMRITAGWNYQPLKTEEGFTQVTLLGALWCIGEEFSLEVGQIAGFLKNRP